MGTFANTASIFSQSADPGAVGAGKIWINSNTNRGYIRNSTNTAWIEVIILDPGATNGKFPKSSASAWILGDDRLGLELLDLHTTSASEASYTFTPSTALTDANYTYILVIYTGDTSGATSMLMQINGDTTANYRYSFQELSHLGVATVVAATGQTSAIIGRCQNSWMVFVKAEIILASGTISKGGKTSSVGITSYLSTEGSWEHDALTGNVTSIKLFLNAGNFEDGSKIAIYGLKRAAT